MELKKNKIIPIYDYVDQVGYQGKGILLQKTFQNKDVEMWLIKLLKTGKEVQRVFYTKTFQAQQTKKI